MAALKPVMRENGSISSQDGGAIELPGTYTTRPIQHQLGKVGSVEIAPAMGSRASANKLGNLNNRKGK